jgi:two-component system chemotaxis sensor kinase CheA
MAILAILTQVFGVGTAFAILYISDANIFFLGGKIMRTNEKKYSKTKDALLVLDFVREASEHLASVEAGLLELRDKPNDQEVLNRIFLAFHAITKTAEFQEFVEIGSLARSTENLLDFARKGRQVLDGKNSDIVFKSIDILKKTLAALKEFL